MARAPKSIVRTLRDGDVRYQLELVRCGKKTCSRCREGPAHGPYWYAYEKRRKKIRRRYLGKELPAEIEARARVTKPGRRREPHRLTLDVVSAMEDLEAALYRLDDRCYDGEVDVDELAGDELELLSELAEAIEDASDELGAAVTSLRRRLARTVKRLRRARDELEEHLDNEDDGDDD